MTKPLRIYLAGKVAKGDDIARAPDWRRSYGEALADLAGIELLSPENPDLDERRPDIVFGHDCWMVKSADLIVVDAPTKLGIGTAQEMVFAKYFGRPVVTVLPRGTHHRRQNLNMHGIIVEDWIHPFIVGMSDVVVESLDDLRQLLVSERRVELLANPKTLSVVDEAIDLYEDEFLR